MRNAASLISTLLIYGDGIDMNATPRATLTYLQESPLYRSCWRYMTAEQRARGACPAANKTCRHYARGRCGAYPKKGQQGEARG